MVKITGELLKQMLNMKAKVLLKGNEIDANLIMEKGDYISVIVKEENRFTSYPVSGIDWEKNIIFLSSLRSIKPPVDGTAIYTSVDIDNIMKKYKSSTKPDPEEITMDMLFNGKGNCL